MLRQQGLELKAAKLERKVAELVLALHSKEREKREEETSKVHGEAQWLIEAPIQAANLVFPFTGQERWKRVEWIDSVEKHAQAVLKPVNPSKEMVGAVCVMVAVQALEGPAHTVFI